MEKVISSDSTEIAFDKSGNGPALILVDGAFCFREYGITPDLVPLLSPVFTVYSYDRRGRGEKSPRKLLKAIEDLAVCVPHSQIRWLKGQRHNVSVKALAPCLIDFFTGISKL